MNLRLLTGHEINDMLAGKALNRDVDDDAPPSRGSAVPTAGTGKPKKKGGKPDTGGMEPQPQ